MQRKTMLASVVVCVLTITACSGTPQTPVSRSGVEEWGTLLNPDGSTMKVSAPSNLGPSGTVEGQRPTLTFTNAIAKFVQVNLGHELEILNASGAVIYSRTLGETAGTTSHTVEIDLPYRESFSYHVRARANDQFGPWSGFAAFQTPAPPPPPPGGGGGTLPFPVPDACGPFGPDGRFPCVAAVAALSVEWRGCAAGRGINCHRFVRQVVYALSRSDPNFQMIVAAPGGHACNCSGCGGSDGSMYREDTTVYSGRRVYDMITGAGGPTPGLTWSFLGADGPRPGDVPRDAPLCP